MECPFLVAGSTFFATQPELLARVHRWRKTKDLQPKVPVPAIVKTLRAAKALVGAATPYAPIRPRWAEDVRQAGGTVSAVTGSGILAPRQLAKIAGAAAPAVRRGAGGPVGAVKIPIPGKVQGQKMRQGAGAPAGDVSGQGAARPGGDGNGQGTGASAQHMSFAPAATFLRGTAIGTLLRAGKAVAARAPYLATRSGVTAAVSAAVSAAVAPARQRSAGGGGRAGAAWRGGGVAPSIAPIMGRPAVSQAAPRHGAVPGPEAGVGAPVRGRGAGPGEAAAARTDQASPRGRAARQADISEGLRAFFEQQARLPPASRTGFDPRLSPAWAGLQIPD